MSTIKLRDLKEMLNEIDEDQYCFVSFEGRRITDIELIPEKSEVRLV